MRTWKQQFTAMTAALLLFGSAPAFAEETSSDLQIFIQTQRLFFTKEENLGMPFVDSAGRTLVPLRKPLEMAGAAVLWDQASKTAKVQKTVNGEEITVEVPIGKAEIRRNGETIPLDTKAQIKEGRTYVPLRAVLEAIGYRVDYDAKTKTIQAYEKSQKTEAEEEPYAILKGEEMNRKVQNVVSWVKENTRNTTKLETLVVDPEFAKQLTLKITEGTKGVRIMKPSMGCMAFVKDGKIVFKTRDILPHPEYTGWVYESIYNDNNYDITKVDYLLIYHFNRTSAILTPNPFRE